MADSDTEQLIQRLQTLVSSPPTDPNVRKRLYEVAQTLFLAVESPHDTVYRVIYSPILLTVAEIAGNLEIFQTLVDKDGSPCSSSELAIARKADVTLVGRVARHLASHGMIEEVHEDAYVANHITKTLSQPGFRAGIKHYLHATMPCLQAAPDFLEDTQYVNPSDMLHSPFQKAFRTDLPRFSWMKTRPDLSENFGRWMTAQHDRHKTWVDVIDVGDLFNGTTAETPVFVDIGGGVGHQCALLRKKLPDLTGRVILQDSENVIQHALPTPGFEKMGFNFWDKQPIKDARAYYMRYIMHDYPDEKCRMILKNTSEAMGPDSVILIDDVIVPDEHAHPHSTDKDIAMMVNFAAMERTQSQWKTLFSSAGLEIIKAATYNVTSGESVQIIGRRT